MPTSGEVPESGPRRAAARWASFVLLAVLVGGMSTAAWQMANRGPPSGPRDLMVLTPEGMALLLDGAQSRIPVTEGVHAFTVTPGTHLLEAQTAEGVGLEQTLNVPKGIGPLMINLAPVQGGKLRIGFY